MFPVAHRICLSQARITPVSQQRIDIYRCRGTTDSKINDPFTQLRLCCYSKYPFLSDDAGRWFMNKCIEREEERLKMKFNLENGTQRINDLLEFDSDLYKLN